MTSDEQLGEQRGERLERERAVAFLRNDAPMLDATLSALVLLLAAEVGEGMHLDSPEARAPAEDTSTDVSVDGQIGEQRGAWREREHVVAYLRSVAPALSRKARILVESLGQDIEDGRHT